MAYLPTTLYCCALFLLSLHLLCSCSHVNGGETQAFHVISVGSLLPSTICSSSTGPNHKSLRVTHRFSPCSPNSHRNKPNHREILRHDKSRVDAIHYLHTTTSQRGMRGVSLAGATIPARPGISIGTGNYITTVGFGTPTKEFSVIFDTGSDLTWIQCNPCVEYCYPQQDPIFDPSQSSTYTNISCNSPDCPLASDPTICAGPTCLYAVQYGDNSYSAGFFARETLTLTPSDVIPDFEFGCGEMNQGLFGRAAGLLGLGRSKVSMASQTFDKYGGVFSYCLPPNESSTGYLNFGANSVSSNVQFTRMIAEPTMPSFYFLELIGISVGGKQLPIPPTVFTDGGTIIDSGTVITRLPPEAYSALRSAFQPYMAKYPPGRPLGILDTCYDLTGFDQVFVPAIALQFGGGVTVKLDGSGILYVVSISQVCLAFTGNGGEGYLSIIGNTQQRTMNVVYDISKGMIGFGAGGCS